MKQQLNTAWKMHKANEQKWHDATVPGSVYHDLLNHGLMEDPFWRENEHEALDICSHDYEYQTTFDVDAKMLEDDRVILVFEGLDTIAKVYLNGQIIGATNNMHRTYKYDVKQLLKAGANELRIYFSSPTAFTEKAHKENPKWGSTDATEGFVHLRKAHCMFGWDWGPRLPDMGIWKDVYLQSFNSAKLEDVYITQNHRDGNVGLKLDVDVDQWSDAKRTLEVVVTDQEGNAVKQSIEQTEGKSTVELEIKDAKLWWPNNYGEQHLYDVKIVLSDAEDKVLDTLCKRIGLRTLTVRQEDDQWGKSFEFVINGTAIFAMGADYIPEDNILARCSKEKTERLIQSCVDANMNCIRIWGGGYYPQDYFYDLCDEYGLIVWQDLMFACGVFEANDDFLTNITEEVKQNVKRIRHHASLGLWCGNNEMEWGYLAWQALIDHSSCKDRTDYLKVFEFILPQLVKEHDPNTFYWLASPSSTGSFEDPNNENIGDVHDWEVWHGLEPFTYFQDHYYRFLSEFGLQSFPCLKTVKTFTEKEDRNIFSPVMENHQKNSVCNEKILHYIASEYRYPKDFDSLLYASQLVQAEGMKYGVEHMRRNRGRCMGAVYWQLNDCWPVASWASIDYFGRWKALQYYAKNFFNPLLVSAKAIKRDKAQYKVLSQKYYPLSEFVGAEICVTNDTTEAKQGVVNWYLRDNRYNILKQGTVEANVDALTAKEVLRLDFAEEIDSKAVARGTYLSYEWVCDGEIVSTNVTLFVKPKHFALLKPEYDMEVTEDSENFTIKLKSSAFVMYLEVDLETDDMILSDNFFHLDGNTEKVLTVKKAEMSKALSLDEFKNQIKLRSLYDINE